VDHGLRRTRLASRLVELQADAFLLTRLPNVRYLTGFTGSNGQVLLTPDDAVFFTDGRYTEQARHEVPDLERVTYLDGFLEPVVQAAGRLGVGRLGFESDGVTFRSYQDLLASAKGMELVPVGGEVERQRWVKDPDELAALDRAQGATDDAFDAIVGRLRDGVTERELAFELEAEMRRAGAERPAFDTIVAFGPDAAEPHHEPTDRGLARGDVVKMDFGALVDGYHADMTRTVAFGEPPGELREVHELVRTAQQAGIDAVRAGATGAEVDAAARSVIEDAGHGERFTHGLGHGVGLEIHEGPRLRRGSDDPLPAGAVVTVEPGVYLPGVGGVRIEDMVEVRNDGCRVLPRSGKDLFPA
jgi:Xaa-Pro aminopeptidase